jgi:hypothetical protein
VRVQVLRAASTKTDYCSTPPCSIVEVDRRFRGTYCLYFQPMMETVRSSETSDYFNKATRLYISERSHPNTELNSYLTQSVLRTFFAYVTVQLNFFCISNCST